MVGLLVTWLVTTLSFLIISRLPIGVEIDSFGKAAISTVVFGILNTILLLFLGFWLNWLFGINITILFAIFTFRLSIDVLALGLVAAAWFSLKLGFLERFDRSTCFSNY